MFRALLFASGLNPYSGLQRNNTMPQIPNLRLLFSSSANHHTSPFFLSPLKIPSSLSLIFKANKTPQTRKPFLIFASSSYKKQRYRSRPFSHPPRNNTSLTESEKKREGLAMRENESVGFNRKGRVEIRIIGRPSS